MIARRLKKRYWLALFVPPLMCVCILLAYQIYAQIFIHMTAKLIATDTSYDQKYHADLYIYSPVWPSFRMIGDGGPEWDDGFARVYDSSGNFICEILVPYAGQGFEHGSIYWDTSKDHKVTIKDASCALP